MKGPLHPARLKVVSFFFLLPIFAAVWLFRPEPRSESDETDKTTFAIPIAFLKDWENTVVDQNRDPALNNEPGLSAEMADRHEVINQGICSTADTTIDCEISSIILADSTDHYTLMAGSDMPVDPASSENSLNYSQTVIIITHSNPPDSCLKMTRAKRTLILQSPTNWDTGPGIL